MEDSNKCMTEKDSSHGGLCAPVNIMKPEQLQETNATSCTSIRKDEPREVKHRSEFVEVSAVAVAADDLVATSVRNGTTGLSVKSEGNGADCRVASTVDVDLKYGSAVHTALNYEPSHLLSAQKGPDSITAEEDAIWTPLSNDVLSGRGASVNANEGNKNFRAICFSYKALFDAGNHAAKNRIATEVWESCVSKYHSRFLKRRQEKGPWYEQSSHKAILKAAQVMRDYQRSDRQDRKRSRTTSTPIEDATVPMLPVGPIVENPSGTHEHDVLCGRGAVRK